MDHIGFRRSQLYKLIWRSANRKLPKALASLDRTGSRWVLSALATWYARKKTGCDMAVWYDDLWIRSLSSKIHIADAPTFKYSVKDFTTFPNLDKSIFEAANDYWFYLYKPSDGGIIIDVGAGVGFDTLVFSRSVGASGKVISIEAHPKTFRRLEKFCELNHLTNTICIKVAAIDKEGDVYIEDLAKHELNSTEFQPTATAVIKIQGLPLDEICKRAQIEYIDLLKMNIEGGERLAIKGMKEMINRTRYACIACHDFRSNESEKFSTREMVVDFLRRNHFDVLIRTNDARPYVRDHVHAVNTLIQ
jgi:FkbM family methyltransferase